MASEGFAKPWLEFEEEFGERPLLYGPVSACFEKYAKLGEKMASMYTFPPPDPTVKTEDRTSDNGVKVRVYTPENYSGDNPVGVYYHGGGWAMGDVEADDPLARAISKAANVVLVSVEYGLAPQNKHPGLMNDCWDAFQWTLNNAKQLGGIEGKAFTIGGSAGAQLALAMALKALDEGLEQAVVGVVAQVPVTVHPDGVPDELKSKYTSYTEFKDKTINTADAMHTFWEAFGVPPADPLGSPLLHARIKDLKKVYLAVAGQDTLRDDGILFKEKLEETKVPYKFDYYEGYPHYHFLYPSPKLDKPRAECMANLMKGVQWVVS